MSNVVFAYLIACYCFLLQELETKAKVQCQGKNPKLSLFGSVSVSAGGGGEYFFVSLAYTKANNKST
jgi:hypothetical protein